jgi:hypothetical protein
MNDNIKSKKFIAIGYTEATHKAAHARVVRVYKLKEETCQEN